MAGFGWFGLIEMGQRIGATSAVSDQRDGIANVLGTDRPIGWAPASSGG